MLKYFKGKGSWVRTLRLKINGVKKLWPILTLRLPFLAFASRVKRLFQPSVDWSKLQDLIIWALD